MDNDRPTVSEYKCDCLRHTDVHLGHIVYETRNITLSYYCCSQFLLSNKEVALHRAYEKSSTAFLLFLFMSDLSNTLY